MHSAVSEKLSEIGRGAYPDKHGSGFPGCLYIMADSSFKIEGFSPSGLILLLSQMDRDRTRQDITEKFAFMRTVLVSASARLQGDAQRLHHILLGIRNDPLGFVPKVVDLFKIIRIIENNLRVLFIIKELPQIRSQGLENIHQGGNGRGGQIPFDLGNEAF